MTVESVAVAAHRRRARQDLRADREGQGPGLRGDDRAGQRGTHRHRSAATRADPAQPAVERVQVHREGRGRTARLRGRRRRARDGRQRQRHRRRAARAGGDLRSVPPGRRQHASALRRHRPRPVDLARPGATARRRHRRAQHARRGQRVHGDVAARRRAAGTVGARRRTGDRARTGAPGRDRDPGSGRRPPGPCRRSPRRSARRSPRTHA